jgi:hypothetical protein
MSIVLKGRSDIVMYVPVIESSSTTLYDYSATGANIPTGGGPSIVESMSGKSSILFNGSTQYALGTNNLGIGGGAVTMSCWIKFVSLPTTGNYATLLVVMSTSSPFVGYYLRAFNSAGVYSFRAERLRALVALDSVPFTFTPVVGTWYHLALTYDGSSALKLYINGENTASGTSTGSGSGAPSYNGVSYGSEGGSGQFSNIISGSIVVMNRLCTKAEIKDLMVSTFIQ